MQTSIFVELTRRSVVAEVLLNGIPVLRQDQTSGIHGALAAHGYLVPGANLLELMVGPGPSPGRVGEAHEGAGLDGAWAMARLIRYPIGVPAEPAYGEVLLELHWRSEDSLRFPRVLSRTASLGPMFGPWGWQSAPRLSLTETTIAELRGLISEIAGTFRRRDLAALMRFDQIRVRDAIRAYPALTMAYIEAEQREFLADVAAVNDLDFSAFEPRLVADGRMIQCVNNDFSSILQVRSANTDEIIPYDLLISRETGRLLPAR